MAGRMLVYLPHDPHIGISQKIDSETERTQLRERLQALMPEGEKGGFIVRTQAEGANDDELNADVAYLRKLWTSVQALARTQPAPPAAPGPDAGAARAARHGRSEHRHHPGGLSHHHRVHAGMGAHLYAVGGGAVRHYSGERPLFDTANVDEESRARCRGAWT